MQRASAAPPLRREDQRSRLPPLAADRDYVMPKSVSNNMKVNWSGTNPFRRWSLKDSILGCLEHSEFNIKLLDSSLHRHERFRYSFAASALGNIGYEVIHTSPDKLS
jgi:hypothetical protein